MTVLDCCTCYVKRFGFQAMEDAPDHDPDCGIEHRDCSALRSRLADYERVLRLAIRLDAGANPSLTDAARALLSVTEEGKG